MAPETDQLFGGLLTWIPPAMMSIVGILIILRRAMQEDDRYNSLAARQQELPQ
jgi:putative membrane protein